MTIASAKLKDIRAGNIKRLNIKEARAAVSKMSKKQLDDFRKEEEEYEVSFLGVKKFKRGSVLGRPKKDFPKEKINIRFDHDVARALRSLGRGWSTRVNDTMRKVLMHAGAL
ncbi:MAG: BrnA antitoxin family protein [Candidatus Margulisbacteria bacterium]|jgi:uncharacterized protein (DUF4415 family)|nr:BrnA antitoxin family protein [Candidatus Margulisiibacteriota bacterium]